MKKTPCSPNSSFISMWMAAILVVGLAVQPLKAATSIWSGAGNDNLWTTAGNWNGVPAAGSNLVFTTTVRLSNTNDFAAATAFNGITFSPVAGAFTLWGNSISLAGGITNNQVVTLETINTPLVLTVSPSVYVTNTGAMNIGGVISGASFGLTKLGGGTLTLAATNNSFGGPLVVNDGTVAVSSDGNLGASPASPTAGNIVLNNGTLQASASFTIATNRGIYVGPGSGSGGGTISVNSGSTVTYRGVITNNPGGQGGLTKSGFGGLTLSGQNTYTGPTSNKVGTVTLDMTQVDSPIDNIINTNSSLTLGGENAGFGAVNFAGIILNGKDNTTNSQRFSKTHITFAGSQIQITNGAGTGKAFMHLGGLTHDAGGTIVIVPPAVSENGGATTTNANQNGILGGWVTIGGGQTAFGLLLSTNLARVDENQNIVNYTNYLIYTTASQINDLVAGTGGTNNVMIDASSTGDVRVDDDGAATTTDVNTLNSMGRAGTGFSIIIGTNNTLRLGTAGVIFRQDTANNITAALGSGTTAGLAGVQNRGVVTAGGPNVDTGGELILHLNSASESTGSLNVECQITDNGTGPVTLVKMGPSSMKLRGHNTYSGGTYVLQGRFQLAGSELSVTGGTGNPDAMGTGPVFCLPGCYLFPSGTGNFPTNGITNSIFIAGNGTSAEPLGAVRGGRFTGPMTLIGDTTIGGNGTVVEGKISGPFSVGLNSPATVTGTVTLSSPSNDWTGNTTLNGRTTGANIFVNGTNETIPNGFGKGNVIMRGGATPTGSGTIRWNLNGFNETINGLSHTNNPNDCFIENNLASTTSTLTIGDNDQSGTFGGLIRNNTGTGGTMALTKIGGGLLTLTRTNRYTGNTTVNGGTLALGSTGTLTNSARITINTNGTFDVTQVSGGFVTPNIVSLDSGTLVGDSRSIASAIGTLNMTNGGLTLRINTAGTNIFAGTLNTSGTNVVNIAAVLGVLTYPTNFVIVKYGTQSGDANFTFGTVPNPVTGGRITNDTTQSAVILVLTNGPQTLTWAGNDAVNPTWWNINTTSNWWDSLGVRVVFNQADNLRFTDTASNTIVDVTTSVLPSQLTFDNSASNYVFVGTGAIGGFGGVVKNGSGSVTFLNSGGDGYLDGIRVNAGSVVLGQNIGVVGGTTIASGASLQVGTNGGTGNLPSGGVVNNGTLIFNRGSDLTAGDVISGSGAIIKNDSAILSLNGANTTMTGTVTVVSGTLKTGSGSALGTTNNGTTLVSGSTLDVNGSSLGAEPVTTAGTGVGSLGAIINSGADTTTALRNVTLTNNTTFGGSGRWDIRQTVTGGAVDGFLGTGGNGYSLTKIGANIVALCGVAVDAGLGEISLNQGTLSIERGTALGNPTNLLTVASGATFQLFSNTVPADKVFILNGSGTNTTVNNGAGVNTISGTVNLNGTTIFNAGGVQLSMNDTIDGTGSFIKTGTGRVIFAAGGNATYSGTTTVSNGLLVVGRNKTGGAGLTVTAGGALGGADSVSITETVTVNGGGLAPGSPTSFSELPQVLTVNGDVSLNSSTNAFELGISPFSGNDRVQVNGNLSLTGTNAMRIVVLNYLTVGDTYTLINYTGAGSNVDTNHIEIIPSLGYEYQLIDPVTTTNMVQVLVTKALGFDYWTAAVNGNWDVNTTANWLKNGLGSVFTNSDIANFLDVPTPTTTNVNIVGTVEPTAIFFTNFALTYRLQGTGKIGGSASMFLAGGVPVYIENSGSNDFTGYITVDADNPDGGGLVAQLVVGSDVVGGGPNGNLGLGPVTNNASIIFNRTGTLIVSNNIFGRGAITNTGTGSVVLSGGGGFTGDVYIKTNATIVANGGTDTFGAATTTNAVTRVENGGTLDVSGNDIGTEMVIASGNGKNNAGAIVNNGPSSTSALQFLTLAGNIRLGGGVAAGTNQFFGDGNTGTNRWDIRGDAWLLTEPPGSNYKITKVGPGQFSLVGVTNLEQNLGDIDILEGAFAIQTSTIQVGNPTNTISVFSNAYLNVWDLSQNLMNKKIVIKGGGAYWSDSGTTTNIGSVTLESGIATIVNDGGSTLRFLGNTVSGAGSLTKMGGGTTVFDGSTNTYSGNTVISNGTVTLIGTSSLTNTPIISLGNTNSTGTVDVLARVDSTLTVRSGQTLRGNGSVAGHLVASAGSTVEPGLSVGTLNVSSNVTLAGTIRMELDAVPATSDRVNSTTNITYGGSLIVTNINGTLSAGQSFQLFSASNYLSSFSSTVLPPLGNTVLLYWTNTLATDGRITVVARPQPRIRNAVTYNGTDLIVDGFSTNGVLAGNYYVLRSTNVTLPISSWTSVQTNAFDGGGGFIFTNPMTAPEVFYIIQVP